MAFFKYLFDNDRLQRDDIEGASADAQVARTLGEGALSNVNALAKTVRAQQEDIRELSVTIHVLLQMLGEAGALDTRTLKYRIEAEMEALAERDEAASGLVTCVECKQTMKAEMTSMTENGSACDRCLATR